ncbi:beta/gamma crystallin domain-containing protein [Noviherbaspirillum aerium]|uniref:beta/gamma crystallin domain-containing protein n=1 Tax=Noviherbaspirillum aerium TaxID=2588497 RepID=UPI00124D9879|nr:beta/gamma crystallin domain-containing protein [Noviherbaspirillum aerium]
MKKSSRQWLGVVAISLSGLFWNTMPANAQATGDNAKEASAPKSGSNPGNMPGKQTNSAHSSGSGNTSGGESANEAKAGTNAGQGKTSAKDSTAALPPGHPSVSYMMVPIAAPESKNWMKKGCWAKFHDNENFSGDMLTLMGPVDMPDMKGPFGIDWKGKISSVETGPKARVMVYDNENYKDLVATFKPGQKSKEVSKKLGFFDEFSSLKILCPGA